MQIFSATLGGKTLTLGAEPIDLIKSVKAKLLAKMGILPVKQDNSVINFEYH
jgi:RNA 3'-terminal phosphate cyclase